MKYLTFDEKTWVLDIETDGLNPTLVWVLVASNMMTGEEVIITNMNEMFFWIEERRKEGCAFVFHNGLHFDGPVLNKLVETILSPNCLIDTLVMSQVYNPSIEGGHALEAWGIRLNFPKIEHEDWSILSPEMIERCRGDVELTKRVYGYLCRKMNSLGFSEMALKLEHYAWAQLRRQRLNGFHYDYRRSLEFQADLQREADTLKADLMVHFPPVLEPVKEYKQARKANGDWNALYLENVERYPRLVLRADGGYTAWDYVVFDPASSPQRVAKLLELGWIPQEFTPKTDKGGGGSPQPTRKGKLSPSLQAFVEDCEKDGSDKGKKVICLVDWMKIATIISMLNTWQNAYNEDTGCIHGQLWLANTHRYKHSGPNTANAPAVKEGEEKVDGKVVKKWPIMGRAGGWAYECRDLWTTRDRRKRRCVGVDAKGIQLRILAEYLDDANFTAAILSEDPHAANARMMGLPGRGIAKTITYAIVMGAGDGRIALEARISLPQAKENKEKFFAKVPGLKNLINRLKSQQKKSGRIKLCDGSYILVDQPHTVIPYLLQGDESKIMKKVMLLVDAECRRRGLDVLQAGFVHDELQYDVAEEDVDAFVALLPGCFAAAGEFFSYRIPIECDAKVGLSWAETH